MKKNAYPIPLRKPTVLGVVYAMSLMGALTSLCGLWSNLFTQLQFWFDRMYTAGMIYGSSEKQKLTALLYLTACAVGTLAVCLILLRLLRRREEYEGLAVWERVIVLFGMTVLIAVSLAVWSAVRHEISSGDYAYSVPTDDYLHATELRGLTASLTLYLGVLLGVERWSRCRAAADRAEALANETNRRLER